MLKVRLLLTVATALLAAVAWVDYASGAPEGNIAEFPLTTLASESSSIAPGPDGNLWFTEFKGNKIGRITIGGAITEFPLATPTSHPEGIAPGPDGNLWFTERKADKIGQITPSGVIAEFSVPSIEGEPEDIVSGSDGNLWFTEYRSNRIGRITPNGAVTEFPLPTPESGPWRIVSGPDGNLWFSEYRGNRIGRITPSGAVTEFPLPAPGSGPLGIASGPDGNLWFTEFTASSIGRITPDGAILEFTIPTSKSFPGDIAPGPDGNLWFTERAGNKIGRITPGGAIAEFPIPTGESAPSHLAPGSDGSLWFTESNANKIARIGTGVPEALAFAPAMTGGGEAGTAQLCSASWTIWASVQPSASLYGFDGYSWQLDGAQIASGQSYTPTVANIGHQLSCAETVTYPLLDVSASATSAPFGVLAPAPPEITAVHQSASVWREGSRPAKISRRVRKHRPPLGSTFSFALSEQASVGLSFTESLAGRKVRGTCVAQSHANAKHRGCTRTVRVGALSFNGSKGTNRVVFQGRLGHSKKLRPGRYTLTIIATNFANISSAPKSLRFTIVK
jgi:streptogramin lyase